MMTIPEPSAPSDAPVYIAIGAQLSIDALVDIAVRKPRAPPITRCRCNLFVELACACKQMNIHES